MSQSEPVLQALVRTASLKRALKGFHERLRTYPWRDTMRFNPTWNRRSYGKGLTDKHLLRLTVDGHGLTLTLLADELTVRRYDKTVRRCELRPAFQRLLWGQSVEPGSFGRMVVPALLLYRVVNQEYTAGTDILAIAAVDHPKGPSLTVRSSDAVYHLWSIDRVIRYSTGGFDWNDLKHLAYYDNPDDWSKCTPATTGFRVLSG